MPLKSKAQNRFMHLVKAMQEGKVPKRGKAGEAAKSMKKQSVKDYTESSTKGLPEKKKKRGRNK